MTSQKHGNYDPDARLPDNRMQPNDSGINVWLQEQIIERLGSEIAQNIIAESAGHKEKRYLWMLDRMKDLGHGDLVEEYHQRRKDLDAERRYRDKERELHQWKQRLAEDNDPRYAMYIQKQIMKIEKYLKERQR